MATTSKIALTEGSGKNMASYSISEDAVTKELQRIALSDSAGAELTAFLQALGIKTDAADTHTDTTAVSIVSLIKQLSVYLATIQGVVGSSKAAVKSASGDFADGSIATIGTKADAKSTATDTTAITAMQVLKEISFQSQQIPAAAALADALANPTTTNLAAILFGMNGATYDRIRVPAIQKDLAALTISTITTVWTPGSGKKPRLMGGEISVSAAGSVLFEDNSAGTTVFRTPKLAADTPYNFVVMGGQGYMLAAGNNVLKATLSVSGTITGTLYGTEE